jgi:hypothetical protein
MELAMRSALFCLTGAFTLALVGDALADDRAACFAAASLGQSLRDDHKLVDARDKLRVCAQKQCPRGMRSDCATWLDAVEKALPTVVISVKDAAWHDVTAGTVTVDGQAWTDKLDGQALPVDPGLHLFRFEGADGTASTQVLINEGEKARKVAIVLPAPPGSAAPTTASASAPAPVPAQAPPPASAEGRSTTKTIGLVTGGVGVAALATGVVLVAVGSGKRGDCRSDGGCPSGPALSDYNSGTTLMNTGYVLLVGGALAAGAGAVLWLTGHPAQGSTAEATKINVGLGPAGLRIAGVFR